MTSPVHWSKMVYTITQLGLGRGAIATILEGAAHAIGALGKCSQSSQTLATGLRNWVRFDTLFFVPNAVRLWYPETESHSESSAQHEGYYKKFHAVSYGLDAACELAQWVLRHLQVPTKGAPIEGVFNLAERAACLGLLVSNVFGIDACVANLENTTASGDHAAAYKKSMRLRIAMRGCIVADATLRLVAKDFAWYKTADICVRVASAVSLLLYLWIDPKSPAQTGAMLNSSGPGGGDDSGKGVKKKEEAKSD